MVLYNLAMRYNGSPWFWVVSTIGTIALAVWIVWMADKDDRA